jgi:hypothetical protein
MGSKGGAGNHAAWQALTASKGFDPRTCSSPSVKKRAISQVRWALAPGCGWPLRPDRSNRDFRCHAMIFRFPGGKARLLSALAPFLDRLVHGHRIFHDVFTGGGSVALFMARRHPRLDLRLNDLDPDLSAFWRTVAGDCAEALCERIHVRPSAPHSAIDSVETGRIALRGDVDSQSLSPNGQILGTPRCFSGRADRDLFTL